MIRKCLFTKRDDDTIKNAIEKKEKQLAKQMVQCYYNHEKNKSEVNFMDSCDGYGRSRKHGAFSCEQGTAVCGK